MPVPRIHVSDLAASISDLVVTKEEDYWRLNNQLCSNPSALSLKKDAMVDYINLVDDIPFTRRQAKYLGKILSVWMTTTSQKNESRLSEDIILEQACRFGPFLKRFSIEEEQVRQLISASPDQNAIDSLFEALQLWDKELPQAVVCNSKLKQLLKRPLRHPSIVSAYIEMALQACNRTL